MHVFFYASQMLPPMESHSRVSNQLVHQDSVRMNFNLKGTLHRNVFVFKNMEKSWKINSKNTCAKHVRSRYLKASWGDFRSFPDMGWMVIFSHLHRHNNKDASQHGVDKGEPHFSSPFDCQKKGKTIWKIQLALEGIRWSTCSGGHTMVPNQKKTRNPTRQESHSPGAPGWLSAITLKDTQGPKWTNHSAKKARSAWFVQSYPTHATGKRDHPSLIFFCFLGMNKSRVQFLGMAWTPNPKTQNSNNKKSKM